MPEGADYEASIRFHLEAGDLAQAATAAEAAIGQITGRMQSAQARGEQFDVRAEFNKYMQMVERATAGASTEVGAQARRVWRELFEKRVRAFDQAAAEALAAPMPPPTGARGRPGRGAEQAAQRERLEQERAEREAQRNLDYYKQNAAGRTVYAAPGQRQLLVGTAEAARVEQRRQLAASPMLGPGLAEASRAQRELQVIERERQRFADEQIRLQERAKLTAGTPYAPPPAARGARGTTRTVPGPADIAADEEQKRAEKRARAMVAATAAGVLEPEQYASTRALKDVTTAYEKAASLFQQNKINFDPFQRSLEEVQAALATFAHDAREDAAVSRRIASDKARQAGGGGGPAEGTVGQGSFLHELLQASVLGAGGYRRFGHLTPEALAGGAARAIPTGLITGGAFTAFYALQTGVMNAVRAATELDKQFGELKAQMAGMGQESQFPRMRDEILGISDATGVAGSDVTQLAEIFLGLTGNVNQAADATKAAAQFMEISGETAAQVGPQIATVWQNLGATATQAADAFVAASAKAARPPGEIAQGVAAIAPEAGLLRMSLNQTTGLVAATARGSALSGADIGTGLGRILENLPSQQGALTQAGVRLTRPGDVKQDLLDVVKQFPGLSQQGQIAAAGALGGARQAEVITALAKNPQAAAMLSDNYTESGAAAKRAAAVNDTAAQSLRRLATTFESLASQLLNAGLGTALSDAAHVATLFGRGLGDLLSLISRLDAAAGHVPSRFLEVAAAIAVLRRVLPAALGAGRGAAGVLGGRLRGMAGGTPEDGARSESTATIDAEVSQRKQSVSWLERFAQALAAATDAVKADAAATSQDAGAKGQDAAATELDATAKKQDAASTELNALAQGGGAVIPGFGGRARAGATAAETGAQGTLLTEEGAIATGSRQYPTFGRETMTQGTLGLEEAGTIAVGGAAAGGLLRRFGGRLGGLGGAIGGAQIIPGAGVRGGIGRAAAFARGASPLARIGVGLGLTFGGQALVRGAGSGQGETGGAGFGHDVERTLGYGTEFAGYGAMLGPEGALAGFAGGEAYGAFKSITRRHGVSPSTHLTKQTDDFIKNFSETHKDVIERLAAGATAQQQAEVAADLVDKNNNDLIRVYNQMTSTPRGRRTAGLPALPPPGPVQQPTAGPGGLYPGAPQLGGKNIAAFGSVADVQAGFQAGMISWADAVKQMTAAVELSSGQPAQHFAEALANAAAVSQHNAEIISNVGTFGTTVGGMSPADVLQNTVATAHTHPLGQADTQTYIQQLAQNMSAATDYMVQNLGRTGGFAGTPGPQNPQGFGPIMPMLTGGLAQIERGTGAEISGQEARQRNLEYQRAHPGERGPFQIRGGRGVQILTPQQIQAESGQLTALQQATTQQQVAQAQARQASTTELNQIQMTGDQQVLDYLKKEQAAQPNVNLTPQILAAAAKVSSDQATALQTRLANVTAFGQYTQAQQFQDPLAQARTAMSTAASEAATAGTSIAQLQAQGSTPEGFASLSPEKQKILTDYASSQQALFQGIASNAQSQVSYMQSQSLASPLKQAQASVAGLSAQLAGQFGSVGGAQAAAAAGNPAAQAAVAQLNQANYAQFQATQANVQGFWQAQATGAGAAGDALGAARDTAIQGAAAIAAFKAKFPADANMGNSQFSQLVATYNQDQGAYFQAQLAQIQSVADVTASAQQAAGNTQAAASAQLNAATAKLNAFKARFPTQANANNQEWNALVKGVNDAQAAAFQQQMDAISSIGAMQQSQIALTGNTPAVAANALNVAKQRLAAFKAKYPSQANTGNAEYRSLVTAVNQAQGNLLEQTISYTETQIGELVATNKISVGQAINQLKALQAKAAAAGNQADVLKIQADIQNYINQGNANAQFNLPANLNLPTLYEVRRTEATPAGGNYYGQKGPVNVNINIGSQTDVQPAVNALMQAVGGPPTTGYSLPY